ncbi:PEP-CTERM sorting domain-containing protein, partial [Novosphingobium sp. BW1]
MSIRTAIAKLSACAAGCAVIGGGAVHVAETQSETTEYRKLKQAKVARPAKRLSPKEKPRTTRRVREIVKPPEDPPLAMRQG